METYCLSDAGIRAFACHLQQREKAPGTIEAYCRRVESASGGRRLRAGHHQLHADRP